ncbi:hypothetical protein TNCV_3462441 [Trichonephila clavipes]|nr:hypothetical protein TNCV_3462441 [Trichonephila clavipes]
MLTHPSHQEWEVSFPAGNLWICSNNPSTYMASTALKKESILPCRALPVKTQSLPGERRAGLEPELLADLSLEKQTLLLRIDRRGRGQSEHYQSPDDFQSLRVTRLP